jgi:hypothetical protein
MGWLLKNFLNQLNALMLGQSLFRLIKFESLHEKFIDAQLFFR